MYKCDECNKDVEELGDAASSDPCGCYVTAPLKARIAQLEKELDELRSACSRCTNVLCTQAGEGS